MGSVRVIKPRRPRGSHRRKGKVRFRVRMLSDSNFGSLVSSGAYDNISEVVDVLKGGVRVLKSDDAASILIVVIEKFLE